MARAIRDALVDETGSILAFLPGQGEIERTARLLEERLPANVLLAPLYGAMEGSAQDAAIRPAPAGSRKIVLATSIAEASITIDGVRVVIDSGLARLPKYEPATGLTRLETVRTSRASARSARGPCRANRTRHCHSPVASGADGRFPLSRRRRFWRLTCPASCSMPPHGV